MIGLICSHARAVSDPKTISRKQTNKTNRVIEKKGDRYALGFIIAHFYIITREIWKKWKSRLSGKIERILRHARFAQIKQKSIFHKHFIFGNNNNYYNYRLNNSVAFFLRRETNITVNQKTRFTPSRANQQAMQAVIKTNSIC